MANKSDVKSGGAAVASVVAGTTQRTFKVIALDGSFREFPVTPLFKGVDVQLGEDEGVITFQDVNHKSNAGRKEKLLNPKDLSAVDLAKSPSRVHPEVLFFSEKHKKYGGLVACVDCGTPVRKWTSDMHQSERCDKDTTKAKRKAAKVKRSAKSSESKAALPATKPDA